MAAFSTDRPDTVSWVALAGGEVRSVRLPGSEAAPVAWLDEARLIVVSERDGASAVSIVQTQERGAAPIATGRDLLYLGWVA